MAKAVQAPVCASIDDFQRMDMLLTDNLSSSATIRVAQVRDYVPAMDLHNVAQ